MKDTYKLIGVLNRSQKYEGERGPMTPLQHIESHFVGALQVHNLAIETRSETPNNTPRTATRA